MKRTWIIKKSLPAASVVLIAFYSCNEAPQKTEIKPAKYTDAQTCFSCHQQQYKEWQNSHHDLAMQEVNEQTVLGNFDNATFTHFGVTSRFFKKDGKFFVNTEGPDGKLADFEIKYTFGVEPLQQYLIEFPGGRLQCLTIAWDVEQNRWYHLYPEEKIPPDDPLHWTKVYQNWNTMCAECHSTNLQKNFDFNKNSYHTTWSAIDVSCQACHGPGSNHVEWAKSVEASGSKDYAPEDKLGLVKRLRTISSKAQVETCAPCHSRRHRVSVENEFGKPLLDNFSPALLRETLYHVDGQILDEVYVYGSFVQSKMYHQGIRCTDCHNPHTAKLLAQDNTLCTRCHNTSPPPQFKTIQAKNYDAPEHHFHKTGQAGANCVDCHMPAKNYMVIDSRRDHSFRIPRPDLTVKIGTPNACNACHQDRTPTWAADKIKQWYNPQYPEPHFAEVITAGRRGLPDAEADLIEIVLDQKKPAIIRATAIELLSGYGPAGLTAIVQAVEDPDPLIRSTAVGSLENLPEPVKITTILPLLNDPNRAVRNEAARLASFITPDSLSVDQQIAYEKAFLEFETVMKSEGDRPSAHLNLAIIYTNRNRPDLAEKSYQTAIELDPYFLPAYVNLAYLYNRIGQNKKAENLYRQAIRRAPESGDLYYSLGLLLAEDKRLEDAAEILAKAAELLPNRARVLYNYSLTLQHLNRREEGLKILLKAYTANALDPDIVNALAIYYVQEENWQRAHVYARKLVKITRGNPKARQFEQQIRARLE